MEKAKSNNKASKLRFSESFRCKTEKAIEIVNRHEEAKFNFLKTLKGPSTKFLSCQSSPMKEKTEDDIDYLNIISTSELTIGSTVKVQILPNSDLIYRVKNPFLGKQVQQKDYTSNDLRLPSIDKHQNSSSPSLVKKKSERKKQAIKALKILREKEDKLKIYIKHFRGLAVQLFLYQESSDKITNFENYSCRYILNSEKIINFHFEEIDRKWIYLRFKSGSEISMFTLRVDEEELNLNHLKKEVDEGEIIQSEKKNEKEKRKENSSVSAKKKKVKKRRSSINLRFLAGVKTQPNEELSKGRSVSLRQFKPIKLQEQGRYPGNQKLSRQQVLQLRQMAKEQKKQRQIGKAKEMARKKEAMLVVKQKELKLKSMAILMKKKLEEYKTINAEQNAEIKKFLPKLAVFLYLPKFHLFTYRMVEERERGMKMAWQTRVTVKKVVGTIKKNHLLNTSAIGNFKKRQLTEVALLTTLHSKILHKVQSDRAEHAILSAILESSPALRLNECFQKATKYRRAVRFVQKAWLFKFKAKMQMFKMYIRDQTEWLFVKYPHFKYVYPKFLADKAVHTLAYRYVSEQSEKVKYIMEEYNQKREEIAEYEDMNRQIKEFNEGLLKKNKKQYLQVPKQPCYPSDRYFRNIPFLKSMVRGWFQLQYRKWAKSNQGYLESMDKQKERAASKKKVPKNNI